MGTLWQQRDAEGQNEGYSASAEEWRVFLRSRVWVDLRYFIQDSIEVAKELLSLEHNERAIPETDESLRGGIKVLRKVLDFPTEQLTELDQVIEDKENEKGE